MFLGRPARKNVSSELYKAFTVGQAGHSGGAAHAGHQLNAGGLADPLSPWL